MEWLNPYANSPNQLLTANDRVIKLWKIEYRKEKRYESSKKLLAKGKLAVPRFKIVNEGFEGRLKRQYKNS